MSVSFHYNGVDMSGSSYGCYLEKIPWQLMGAPGTDVQAVAQSFGGVGRSVGFGPLGFDLSVVVAGSSRSNLLTKFDAIKYLMNPENGEKTLRFDCFSDRYWKALLNGAPSMSWLGQDSARVQLPMVAPDMRAWSTTARSSPAFTISSSPQTLTVEAGPTAVAGTAICDPVWVIKAGATVSQLTLNNTTLGESITWIGALSSGHWLRIATWLDGFDVAPVEKSTDSGATWASAMSGCSGAFYFPRLQGGVANSVTLTGLSSGSVELTYTGRYL